MDGPGGAERCSRAPSPRAVASSAGAQHPTGCWWAGTHAGQRRLPRRRPRPRERPHPALIHSGWPWSVRRSTHFTPPRSSSMPAGGRQQGRPGARIKKQHAPRAAYTPKLGSGGARRPTVLARAPARPAAAQHTERCKAAGGGQARAHQGRQAGRQPHPPAGSAAPPSAAWHPPAARPAAPAQRRQTQSPRRGRPRAAGGTGTQGGSGG